MPRTVVRVFRTEQGRVPLQAWLDDLEENEPRAYAKCLYLIRALAEHGSALRRPLADSLQEGIKELRARIGTVHYRILYFFCGHNEACLSHGITKEGKIPNSEIQVALRRKNLVKFDLEKYTADWQV